VFSLASGNAPHPDCRFLGTPTREADLAGAQLNRFMVEFVLLFTRSKLAVFELFSQN